MTVTVTEDQLKCDKLCLTLLVTEVVSRWQDEGLMSARGLHVCLFLGPVKRNFMSSWRIMVSEVKIARVVNSREIWLRELTALWTSVLTGCRFLLLEVCVAI